MKFIKNICFGMAICLTFLFLSSCDKYTFPVQGGVNPPKIELSGDSLCVSFQANGDVDLKSMADSLIAHVPQKISFTSENEQFDLYMVIDSVGVGHVVAVSKTCVKIK